MPTRPRFLAPILVLAVAVMLGGCGSAAPSSAPTPAPSPVPSLTLPISTAEDAMAAVVVAEPRFGAVRPRDLDLIGQAAWWEARPASGVGAFVVSIRMGWGDCPAGCIDEHHWTYAVTPDGGVRLLSEDGPPVPADAMPGDGTGSTGVRGRATAGPVCPVETIPPDPACAPRPVTGARVVVIDASGTTVAETVTDDAGAFSFDLAPGDYTIRPEPVDGLMGTPASVDIQVVDGAITTVDLAYDTGIR